MRIGFSSIYSWRPHVEHLWFLSRLAESAGHEAFFLTCDSDLPTCYTRELRDRPALLECLQCRAGGVRSYARRNVSSIGALQPAAVSSPPALLPPAPPDMHLSSASTLGRFETDAEFSGAEFAALASRLQPVTERAYAAALRWITTNRLDAVCVFNGRMDATRAIYEAARSLHVRVVTLERTWFGDGLQLFPDENALGLQAVHRMVAEWRERPLTKSQAIRAVSHVSRRFLRSNVTEWRAYNRNAVESSWPVEAAARRILLVPGSRNEVWGHPDWVSLWPEPTAAYDALIAHFGLTARDLVLRCHPNWGEHIGRSTGERSERYYVEWAARRGVHCIGSKDPTSTLGLIAQADAIVVSNGSAALEAGILGKQVIGTAPAVYQEAGMRDAATTPAEMARLQLDVDLDEAARTARSAHIRRQTLRFCYTMIYRIPQYTRYVIAETTTRYRYDLSAPPARFLELLQSGRLQADDATFADDARGEEAVLDAIGRREWASLLDAGPERDAARARLLRRPLMRVVDAIARVKSVGDR